MATNLFPATTANTWRLSVNQAANQGSRAATGQVNASGIAFVSGPVTLGSANTYDAPALRLIPGGAYKLSMKVSNAGSPAATFKILQGGGLFQTNIIGPNDHNGTAIYSRTVPGGASDVVVEHAWTVAPGTAEADARYAFILIVGQGSNVGTLTVTDVFLEQTNLPAEPSPPAGSLFTGDAFTFGGTTGTNPWTAVKSPQQTGFSLNGVSAGGLQTGAWRLAWRGGVVSPKTGRGHLKAGDVITATWKLRNVTTSGTTGNDQDVRAEILLGTTIIATSPGVWHNQTGTGAVDPVFKSGTLTAVVPEGHNFAAEPEGEEGPRLRFFYGSQNTTVSVIMELAEPALIVPAYVPPVEDPGGGGGSQPAPSGAVAFVELAQDVAKYLGREGDAPLVSRATKHVETVFWYISGYTRGRGVQYTGDGTVVIPPDLRAVLVAAAGRLAPNPEQISYYAANDYSERPAILAGWTLLERGVLHNYRRRTA